MHDEGQPPAPPASSVQQEVLRRIQALANQSFKKASDSFYTSGRHNYGVWILRGYGNALRTVEDAPPNQGESAGEYLSRLRALLETVKDEYARDPDDEDGGATGAVASSIRALDKVRRTCQGGSQ
jgi:hypothetical protein